MNELLIILITMFCVSIIFSAFLVGCIIIIIKSMRDEKGDQP